MAWEHGRIRYFREKTSAPTVNDDENDGYRESDVWVDETNNKAYMCLDASAGSADWNQIDAGAGVDADTLVADVKEANVSAVKKGQPCAIVGSSGAKFEVQLADCDNVNLIRLLGIAKADTAKNETGTVIHKGLLTNVDTQTTNSNLNPGAETWAAGEMLYVSQTPGGLTKTPPTSGRCIKACRSLKGNSASDTLLAIVHTNPICACAASGEDVCSRMGDSAGANKHSFKNYASNEVAAIDSNGNLTLSGTVDGKGLQTTAETELTVSAGVITVTQLRHKIDTEADAASDDLVTINGGATVNMIVLRAEADARTIVVKHNTGNIWLQGKADISLDDLEDGVLLFWDSTNSKWFDVGRVGGGGAGDVTAAANIDTNAIVIGDDGAKGIKGISVTTDNILLANQVFL